VKINLRSNRELGRKQPEEGIERKKQRVERRCHNVHTQFRTVLNPPPLAEISKRIGQNPSPLVKKSDPHPEIEMRMSAKNGRRGDWRAEEGWYGTVEGEHVDGWVGDSDDGDAVGAHLHGSGALTISGNDDTRASVPS
jgi:hypothetical protein